ncbi:hypothetical protein LLEC1_01033 [Akanthomyces lecanii]|uniref:Uncharacterized protein n=1 Tax=Cordyceps confragosa TaxID=2714763 RepID=A0A179I1Q3_CORDF|nr:hypothetical protein LLEC1_01033 [Akanthomyces lecanii]
MIDAIEVISAPQQLIPRPRILVQHQPDELKEPFVRAYPNGIPKDYNMWRAPADEIPKKYIEDNLPVGFYTNPPSGAKAIFSTASGLRPFRHMHHILPRRRLHLWSKNEIQQNCNSIRQLNWAAMRCMTEPFSWDDLWQYFDAFDLYHHGAINLWNVINHLYAENKIILTDFMKSCALELGYWVTEWLKAEGNVEKLKNWETSKGSVIQVLDVQDWESLGTLTDAGIPLLTNALKCRRDHLLSPTSIESSEPQDLLSSSRNEGGLENWMTGQEVHPPTGLQQHKHGQEVKTKNFNPPCIVVDGRHYYDPLSRSKGAVEALKASVEAASNHVIVANGSKMSPPRYTPAGRLTVKKDCIIGKSVAHSQQGRPKSSDGSTTTTAHSSGSSFSGSPRRISDSTVRPSHLSSPEVGLGPIVAPGSFAAAGDPAPRLQSPFPSPVPGQA